MRTGSFADKVYIVLRGPPPTCDPNDTKVLSVKFTAIFGTFALILSLVPISMTASAFYGGSVECGPEEHRS